MDFASVPLLLTQV